jgi:peptidoglycan/xylan/chitin deacetylase (PgdA/CDA1 family)
VELRRSKRPANGATTNAGLTDDATSGASAAPTVRTHVGPPEAASCDLVPARGTPRRRRGPAWLGPDLAVAPPAVYRAKATLTRARSVSWAVRAGRRPAAPGVRILFYHRVADGRDELALPPARFAAHMEALAVAGLRAVAVEELPPLIDAGADGVVGLCFDDGYRDVAEHALPVLERLGHRATVFVATGVVDGDATFSWYGSSPPPVLSWGEIADLARGPTLRFGAHTVTHPDLRALDDRAARAEIAGSKVALEAHIDRPVASFCYPAGLFGPRERALVAEAEFAVATSCDPGANLPGADPLALRRIQVDRRDGVVDVRAKAFGGLDRPPAIWAAARRRRYRSAAAPPAEQAG